MAEPAIVAPPNGAPPPPAQAAKPPATPPAPPAQDDRAAAIAAQVKKEQELVAKQQKFAADRAAWLKEQEAANAALAKERTEIAEWKKRQENALRDPASWNEPVYGKDWIQKLNEYALNAKQVTPELIDAHVEKRISTLEQRIADERAKEKAEAEKASQAEQQRAVEAWRADVIEGIKANTTDYELIGINQAWNLVPNVIEDHYAKTQKILSPKEAADQVEKYLEGVVEQNLQSKKWQAKVAQKPAQQAGSSTTLTPRMFASTPSTETVGKTEQERIERAIKAAEAVEARRKQA